VEGEKGSTCAGSKWFKKMCKVGGPHFHKGLGIDNGN
jgi:hypothetical protein